MPKTKAQGILFGLIMSYSMAIGMESTTPHQRWALRSSPAG